MTTHTDREVAEAFGLLASLVQAFAQTKPDKRNPLWPLMEKARRMVEEKDESMYRQWQAVAG